MTQNLRMTTSGCACWLDHRTRALPDARTRAQGLLLPHNLEGI
jgi:hypothetical protein